MAASKQTKKFQGVVHKRHTNPDGKEGGWVAETATVHPQAWIHRNARVGGTATVESGARIDGTSLVVDKAVVRGPCVIEGASVVKHSAVISGRAHIVRSVIYDHAQIEGAHVIGCVLGGEFSIAARTTLRGQSFS